MLPAGFSSADLKQAATNAKIDAARKTAWTQFTNQFPNVDKGQFMAQIYDDGHNISAEMFFKEGPGSLQSVFGSDRKYWSQRMKTALGLAGVDGFPYQLLQLKTKRPLPIPVVNFTESPGSILGKLYSGQMKIYATPE